VVEYAVLPKSTKFAGGGLINWLEDKPVGSVPCLAIVESLRDGEFTLVYCDRDWSIRAFSTHESVARAKKRAERVYPGSHGHWTHRRVTVAVARDHIANSWKGHECSFCGKTPAEIDGGFMEGKNARICASCAAHAYEALAAGSPKAESAG
jgi:hypothetical protein